LARFINEKFAVATGPPLARMETLMTRADDLDPKQRARYEPLYTTDPNTGTITEVFHADRVLTGMKGAGWHWWSCKPGHAPEWPPIGPFGTAFRAFRNALKSFE
jgi:hypothetical protein